MHQFENLIIGSKTKVDEQIVSCRKTYDSFNCGLCHFKEINSDCPQGNSRPLCFASERTDIESVFYPQIKSV